MHDKWSKIYIAIYMKDETIFPFEIEYLARSLLMDRNLAWPVSSICYRNIYASPDLSVSTDFGTAMHYLGQHLMYYIPEALIN